MSLRISRAPVLLLIALAIPILAGCAHKTSGIKQHNIYLTEEDSDDVAQQLAATFASDHGGWIFEWQTTVAAIPRVTSPFAPGTSARPSVPSRIARDTTIVIGGMTYNINYTYLVHGAELPNWDPEASIVDVLSSASGTQSLPDVSANFIHYGDFEIDSLDSGDHLLPFTGLTDDTSQAVIRSTFRADTTNYFLDVFYSFEALVHNDLAVNSYPISGLVEFIIDADQLNSPLRTDVNHNILAEASLTFDGTRTPVLVVTDDPDNPTATYRYRVDLKTGAVTKL